MEDSESELELEEFDDSALLVGVDSTLRLLFSLLGVSSMLWLLLSLMGIILSL